MRFTIAVLIAGTLLGAACANEDETARTAEAERPRSLLEQEQSQAEATLTAENPLHDFGQIPIGGGDVSTVFTLTNEADDAVDLAAVYTSCGCTSAVLELTDGTRIGPFGMPGHGEMPEVHGTVEPGESIEVRVTFDPAAHGPQGLGSVMRAVNIHSRDGSTTELRITADVVQS